MDMHIYVLDTGIAGGTCMLTGKCWKSEVYLNVKHVPLYHFGSDGKLQGCASRSCYNRNSSFFAIFISFSSRF